MLFCRNLARRFLCRLGGQQGLCEIAGIKGALPEWPLAVALCPDQQRVLRVRYPGIVADAKADLGAPAILATADNADRGAGFHGLPGFYEGAVLFHYSVLRERAICMEDLHEVPVGRRGRPGVILGVADIHCRYHTPTRGIDSVPRLCTEADGITAVLGARIGTVCIGYPIGLGLDTGSGGKKISEIEVDHRVEQAFAVGGFIVELRILRLVDGRERQDLYWPGF